MKTIGTLLCMFCFLVAGPVFADDKKTDAKQSKEVKEQTKTTTSSDTAKPRADIVNGKVKSYEAGKSIRVSVPGTVVQTKSFDLDGKDVTAHVAANVKVGEWVRVTEKTADNGHKTITVQRSSEK